MDFLEDLFDLGGHKRKKYGDGHYDKHNDHEHHDEYYEDENHNHERYESQSRQGAFCPRCSTQVMQGAKFCQNCGTTLNMASNCSKCGLKITSNASFCPECGNKLR